MRDLIAWKRMTTCKYGMIDVEDEVASLKINDRDNIKYIRDILNKNNDGKLNLDGETTYLFSRVTLEKLTSKVEPEVSDFMSRCLDDNSNIFYLDII